MTEPRGPAQAKRARRPLNWVQRRLIKQPVSTLIVAGALMGTISYLRFDRLVLAGVVAAALFVCLLAAIRQFDLLRHYDRSDADRRRQELESPNMNGLQRSLIAHPVLYIGITAAAALSAVYLLTDRWAIALPVAAAFVGLMLIQRRRLSNRMHDATSSSLP